MKKKRDNNIFLIIICILLLFIIVLLFLNDKDEDYMKKEEKLKYSLVSDYSVFFTINSCVYKYVNFISNKQTDDLLQILDSKYIEKNNINNKNLYNYVNQLDGIYTFKTKKIYYEEKNKNQYYVYGYLIKESIDGITDKQDYYLIINLNTRKQLFSIVPYDGELFKEAK